MADPILAGTLVRILREEGLEVREYGNWRDHNRNHKGAWGPINGVMIHHTVTRGTDATVRLCYEGYSSLPGPLCHGVIAKDGSVHLVGNGRANHAGLGDDNVLQAVIEERSSLPEPNERNTDGNARFYGFECINMGDGEDPWPAKQLDAIERASAAICRHYGWSAESVVGHKEWSYTKIDPRGFSMEEMRRRINNRLAGPAGGQEDDVTEADKDEIVNRVLRAVGSRVWNWDGIEPLEPTEANPTHQAENAVTSMWHRLDSIEGKVDQIAVGGVDLDALAAKVADLLAARLAQ